MSYIKITIGGKERGLKFNQLAILEIGERNGKNKYAKDTLQHELYATTSILFAGLRGNAFAKDIDEDFTWEDCADYAEEITPEVKIQLIETLTSSEKYKEGVLYQAELTKADKAKPKKKSPLKSTKASSSK